VKDLQARAERAVGDPDRHEDHAKVLPAWRRRALNLLVHAQQHRDHRLAPLLIDRLGLATLHAPTFAAPALCSPRPTERLRFFYALGGCRRGVREARVRNSSVAAAARPSASMGTVVSLAIYDREQCWPRWSGTIGELQDAAELAATEIQEWTGEDPEISIRVVERGGLTVTLDQHTELPNAVDVRDLPRVKILSIEVGRYGMARAEIRLEGTWLGAGMRLSVRGGDRTRVEGLTRQLSDALTPRYSVGVPGLYGTRAVIAFNAAFVATLTVATLAVRAVLDIDNIAWRLVIVFGSGALVTATTV